MASAHYSRAWHAPLWLSMCCVPLGGHVLRAASSRLLASYAAVSIQRLAWIRRTFSAPLCHHLSRAFGRWWVVFD